MVRTGVTVLDPGGDVWARPSPAGVAVLNGAGELTGRSQVEEWGLVETPVFLTATMPHRSGVRRGLPAADGRAGGDRRR